MTSRRSALLDLAEYGREIAREDDVASASLRLAEVAALKAESRTILSGSHDDGYSHNHEMVSGTTITLLSNDQGEDRMMKPVSYAIISYPPLRSDELAIPHRRIRNGFLRRVEVITTHISPDPGLARDHRDEIPSGRGPSAEALSQNQNRRFDTRGDGPELDLSISEIISEVYVD